MKAGSAIIGGVSRKPTDDPAGQFENIVFVIGRSGLNARTRDEGMKILLRKTSGAPPVSTTLYQCARIGVMRSPAATSPRSSTPPRRDSRRMPRRGVRSNMRSWSEMHAAGLEIQRPGGAYLTGAL
jgi:hypothetical protein